MNLGRDTVRKEAIYVAPGLDESGWRYRASGYIPSKVPSCGKRFPMSRRKGKELWRSIYTTNPNETGFDMERSYVPGRSL